MESLELTQRLLSIGDTYEVRSAAGEPILATIRGKVSVSPELRLAEGEDGKELGKLTGNAINSRFEITAGDARAELTVPAIEFHRSFSLKFDGEEYRAEGGWQDKKFECKKSSGALLFSLERLSSATARFEIKIGDDMPRDLALLAAVAVHQAHF